MVPAAARSLPKSKGKIRQAPVKQRETARKSRKRAGLGKRMFGAILITGLLIGSLALRAQVIDTGYRLHILERTLAATQTEYDRLSLSIAQLSSLARVEREAMISLGMTNPKKTEFIMVASANDRLNVAEDSDRTASQKLSRVVAEVSARTEDILIGLISPFVARWFYDIPRCDHPRVRPK